RANFIAGLCATIDRASCKTFGMNFARVICDRRAAQSIMRNIAFALQAGNQHVFYSLSERVPIPPNGSAEICFGSCAPEARSANRIDRVDRRESINEKSTVVSPLPPTARL